MQDKHRRVRTYGVSGGDEDHVQLHEYRHSNISGGFAGDLCSGGQEMPR